MGCGFAGSEGTRGVDGPDGVTPPGEDGEPIAQENIDFLLPAEEMLGNTDWSVDDDAQIDTGLLTVTPSLPIGVTMIEGTQHDGKTKIAVLRVKDFKVAAGVKLTVRGSRPLFILSSHDVIIDGTLDVGARGNVAGPGGSAGGAGPGAGAISLHDGSGGRYDDSGAGGGSFGTVGAAGGKVRDLISAAGAVYELGNALVGGASGGRAGTCTNPPGAGGGALLIYAGAKISVEGEISSGGGGGAGGLDANCAPGAGAGAGGGSGGTIWLQTPKIEGAGFLAANGGAGGGASFVNKGNGLSGGDGLPRLQAAIGGAKADDAGATAGGNGAIAGTPASMVSTLTGGGNGGGGGGGLGRIVYRAPDLGALEASPTAERAP